MSFDESACDYKLWLWAMQHYYSAKKRKKVLKWQDVLTAVVPLNRNS